MSTFRCVRACVRACMGVCALTVYSSILVTQNREQWGLWKGQIIVAAMIKTAWVWNEHQAVVQLTNLFLCKFWHTQCQNEAFRRRELRELCRPSDGGLLSMSRFDEILTWCWQTCWPASSLPPPTFLRRMRTRGGHCRHEHTVNIWRVDTRWTMCNSS